MEASVATLKGSQNRRDIKVDIFPYVIGRCRTANFIIPHINVSRNHCHIVRDNLLWKVIDYSSSGTYVNNELIGKRQSRILKSGDVIRFGSAENNLWWTFSASNESVNESEQPEGLSSGTNTTKDHTKDNTINSKTLPTGTNHEGNKTNENLQELRQEGQLRVPAITYGFSLFVKPNVSHFGSKEKSKEKGCGEIETEPEACEVEIIECKKPERKDSVITGTVHNKNDKNEFPLNSNMTNEKVKLKAETGDNQVTMIGEKRNLQKEDIQNHSFVPEKNENEKDKIKCYLPKLSVIKGPLNSLPQKPGETNITVAQCFSKTPSDQKDQQDQHSSLPKRPRMEIDIHLQVPPSRSKKTEELMEELEQLKSTLSDLESKNSALKGELAAARSGKNEAMRFQTDLLGNLAGLMEDELQCTICSELFIQAVTLNCTHTFCKKCIGQWRKRQKTCPICRKKIISETRSLVVDNYIEKMVGSISKHLKDRRDALVAERNAALQRKI